MSMMVTFKVSWWEEVCPLWAPIPIRPLIVRALILSYPLGTLSSCSRLFPFWLIFYGGGAAFKGGGLGGEEGF